MNPWQIILRSISTTIVLIQSRCIVQLYWIHVIDQVYLCWFSSLNLLKFKCRNTKTWSVVILGWVQVLALKKLGSENFSISVFGRFSSREPIRRWKISLFLSKLQIWIEEGVKKIRRIEEKIRDLNWENRKKVWNFIGPYRVIRNEPALIQTKCKK